MAIGYSRASVMASAAVDMGGTHLAQTRANDALTTFPTAPEFRLWSSCFRVVLFRRLRLRAGVEVCSMPWVSAAQRVRLRSWCTSCNHRLFTDMNVDVPFAKAAASRYWRMDCASGRAPGRPSTSPWSRQLRGRAARNHVPIVSTARRLNRRRNANASTHTRSLCGRAPLQTGCVSFRAPFVSACILLCRYGRPRLG